MCDGTKMIGVTPKDGKTAEWIGEPIGVADVLVGIKRRKLTAQQATLLKEMEQDRWSIRESKCILRDGKHG